MIRDCEGRELSLGDRVVVWNPKRSADILLGGVIKSMTKRQVVVLTDKLGGSLWHGREITCNKPQNKMAKIDCCPKCELPWETDHECAPPGCLGVAEDEHLRKLCPACGEELTLWPGFAECDGEYECTKHSGGCGAKYIDDDAIAEARGPIEAGSIQRCCMACHKSAILTDEVCEPCRGMLALLEKSWPQVVVGCTMLHSSSVLTDVGFHAKWCEKTGLLISVRDIESMEVIEGLSGGVLNVILKDGPSES